MTTEQQIKAIAELDGWTVITKSIKEWSTERDAYVPVPKELYERQLDTCLQQVFESNLPTYLTSRDAIVPVIEKQVSSVLNRVQEHLWNILERDYCLSLNRVDAIKFTLATPLQLCEALLRATGKWIE